MRRWVLLFVALVVMAPGIRCQTLTGGLRAGAGGSLFYGGWVADLRDELAGLGAASVRDRLYASWRAGGWLEFPLRGKLFLRVEPGFGAVGGALLASDGYDLLVGVTGIELAVPVLAVTRLRIAAGEVVLGAGLFVGGAVSIRQVSNDGVIRSEGELASVLGCAGLAAGAGYVLPVGPGALTADLRVLASLVSFTAPWLDGMLNTVSVELTAGWAFGRREVGPEAAR